MRLNRYISDTGHCSRREADRLIGEGRVTVNGQRAGIGAEVVDDEGLESHARAFVFDPFGNRLRFSEPFAPDDPRTSNGMGAALWRQRHYSQLVILGLCARDPPYPAPSSGAC